ncbi:MAG: metal-dependent transcriptional regulator [Eubacteriales bacterium]
MPDTQIKHITSSREDYLRIIYELSQRNETIRSSDIAEKLGITRASVSRMMEELKSSGLVEKEKYGCIALTEAGYRLAVQIKTKHDILVSFLVDVLGVNSTTAKIDACRMEHAISQETAERLNNQLYKLLKNKEENYVMG